MSWNGYKYTIRFKLRYSKNATYTLWSAKLKVNNEKIKGVLHYRQNNKKYDLRRYFPGANFNSFIEQIWIVDWNLKENQVHKQQNIPDPNFHLVINNNCVKLLGPVSKVYSFNMRDTGRIIGVKFECGALTEHLSNPVCEYVDKDFLAKKIFAPDFEEALLALFHVQSDGAIVNEIQKCLEPFVPPLSVQKNTTQRLVSLIKNNEDICKVEQLSQSANISQRAVQRYFSKYVGLSPKWVIRKYRLSKVLEELENSSISILDVVSKLGYVDQSHLIRDSKEILGVTPKKYARPT